MALKREFDYRICNIETGCNLLLTQHLQRGKAKGGYVDTIASYGGELDRDSLKKALESLAPKFPLILSCYGMGRFKRDPSDAGLPDEARTYRHNCSFTFVCCDNSLRGEESRRRGVFLMISDVLEILSGVRFEAPDPEGEEDDTMLLNLDPFTPAAVELIARMPHVSSYAVHFDTYVPFTSHQVRDVGIPVDQIVFGIDPLDSTGRRGGLPGVHANEERL